MRNYRKSLAALLLAAMLLMNACGQPQAGETDTSDDPFDITTVAPESTDDTTADTTTAAPETTVAPEIVEPEIVGPEIVGPEIINPLTGLEAEVDYSDRRPVAIMINNIKVATPQEGISYADIMYECIVEGAQTRLMMVVSDWENLPVVGSVRSSREYYLDFAANHNALYVHAGGSTQAYTEIKSRDVDNLDGVNMYIPNMFYRDTWRQKNMGYEHSLMTSGEKIADGIEYCKYDTALAKDFDSPLDFVPYGEIRVPSDGKATYLKVKYSNAHLPYFEYNADEGVYYRWQFTGDKHMDNTAKVQLSFTNVIVLYCKTASTGDSYNHMDVTTTGSGEGYYLSAGGYEKITWEKSDEDSPLRLYNDENEELLINRGKTFFQICTTSMKDSTELK